MNTCKPAIFFKARYENNTHYILPACPEADAFFELLKRGHISHSELPLVHKMGFDIFVAGDNKELAREMRRRNEAFNTDKGVINYGNTT